MNHTLLDSHHYNFLCQQWRSTKGTYQKKQTLTLRSNRKSKEQKHPRHKESKCPTVHQCWRQEIKEGVHSNTSNTIHYSIPHNFKHLTSFFSLECFCGMMSILKDQACWITLRKVSTERYTRRDHQSCDPRLTFSVKQIFHSQNVFCFFFIPCANCYVKVEHLCTQFIQPET